MANIFVNTKLITNGTISPFFDSLIFLVHYIGAAAANKHKRFYKKLPIKHYRYICAG